MNNNQQQQNFFMGALLGGLAGATAMLLFTPLSGERLRNRLMNGIGLESMVHKKRPSRSSRVHVIRASSRSTKKGHGKAISKRATHKVVRTKRAKSAHHAINKESHPA